MSTMALPADASKTFDKTEDFWDVKTQSATLCKHHTPTPTPRIDAHLHTPQNRAYLLTLSEALADLADSEEPHCTKCIIDTVAETLTKLLKDVKTAKKNGEWTKEEKKALKKEAKMLGKGMKGQCERARREGEIEKKKGWWG